MNRYEEEDDYDRDHRERRSSNKSTLMVLGVGAAILGVCLLACGGLFYLAAKVIGEGMAAISTNMQQAMQQAQQMQQEMQAVQTTADAFLGDIAAGRLDGAYARTTKDFQARRTLPQFRAFVSQNPALKNYQADSLDEPNFTSALSATFEGTVRGPNGDVAFTLVVTKDEQVWKVDRFTIP
ncbi:MAG TPA: hypothetical protein VGG61_12345 [Gemmataceae bacterium]